MLFDSTWSSGHNHDSNCELCRFLRRWWNSHAKGGAWFWCSDRLLDLKPLKPSKGCSWMVRKSRVVLTATGWQALIKRNVGPMFVSWMAYIDSLFRFFFEMSFAVRLSDESNINFLAPWLPWLAGKRSLAWSHGVFWDSVGLKGWSRRVGRIHDMQTVPKTSQD